MPCLLRFVLIGHPQHVILGGIIAHLLTTLKSIESDPFGYYNQETKLHYNWHRYYDPGLGRYITSDPIGIRGGVNTYRYANANPVMFYDKEGKTPAHAAGAGLVFAAGFIGAYLTNGGNVRDAFFSGLQGGAAGFITAGGSVLGSLAFSAGTAATAQYIKCKTVNLKDVAVSTLMTLGSGHLGTIARAATPIKRVPRKGVLGFLEDHGIISPKFVESNPSLSATVEAGVAGGVDGLGQSLYSGLNSKDECECK